MALYVAAQKKKKKATRYSTNCLSFDLALDFFFLYFLNDFLTLHEFEKDNLCLGSLVQVLNE